MTHEQSDRPVAESHGGTVQSALALVASLSAMRALSVWYLSITLALVGLVLAVRAAKSHARFARIALVIAGFALVECVLVEVLLIPAAAKGALVVAHS